MTNENRDENIKRIEKVLSEREESYHGIYYDVYECLKDIPTIDLVQYCIEKFGEGLIRDHFENQIISDEINKHQMKDYDKYTMEYEDELSL